MNGKDNRGVKRAVVLNLFQKIMINFASNLILTSS